MTELDIALSIALGIGLAAATGFRVFLPMLVMSSAAYAGYLPLGENFAWLATPAALVMLAIAAIVEVVAYYVPVLDNMLDTVATPAAFVAGTVVSAAVLTDLPPMMKWTTAVIAGGGIAGATQGVTALLRAKSTVLTGGLGNSGHRHGRARQLAPRVAVGARRALHRPRTGCALLVAGRQGHPPDW